MRVPTIQTHRNIVQFLTRAQMNIHDIQRQIATGKRIHKPSDDPAGTVEARALRQRLEDTLQFRRNIDNATLWTGAADLPLNGVVETLTRMKELVLDAVDDLEGHAVYGDQIDGLLDELVSISQSKLGERYLFSGFQSDQAPYVAAKQVVGDTFVATAPGTNVSLTHARLVAGTVVVRDAAGTTTFVEGVDYDIDSTTGTLTILAGSSLANGVSYEVDYETETTSSVTSPVAIQGDIVRHIDGDRTLTVNFTAPEVFENGVNMFQLGIGLKNALWKGDVDGVRALLDSIDQALVQATQVTGILGARMQALQTQESALASDEIMLRQFISDVEDVDIAEAAIRLQAEQSAYEYALAAAARLMQISIVDRL